MRYVLLLSDDATIIQTVQQVTRNHCKVVSPRFDANWLESLLQVVPSMLLVHGDYSEPFQLETGYALTDILPMDVPLGLLLNLQDIPKFQSYISNPQIYFIPLPLAPLMLEHTLLQATARMELNRKELNQIRWEGVRLLHTETHTLLIGLQGRIGLLDQFGQLNTQQVQLLVDMRKSIIRLIALRDEIHQRLHFPSTKLSRVPESIQDIFEQVLENLNEQGYSPHFTLNMATSLPLVMVHRHTFQMVLSILLRENLLGVVEVQPHAEGVEIKLPNRALDKPINSNAWNSPYPFVEQVISKHGGRIWFTEDEAFLHFTIPAVAVIPLA